MKETSKLIIEGTVLCQIDMPKVVFEDSETIIIRMFYARYSCLKGTKTPYQRVGNTQHIPKIIYKNKKALT